MPSINAAVPGGAPALPHRFDGEAQLLVTAREALAPAALLLAHCRAPLLTIAGRRGDGGSEVRIILWTDGFEVGEALSGRKLSSRALRDARGRLRACGTELYNHLSRRWPPQAVPPVIGVITDGTGMAVCSGHPAALSDACLLDHAARVSPASVLIPFRANGPWALVEGAWGRERSH